MFHTCWFLESLCTQTLVIHIIRTGRVPFVQSRASILLIFTSIVIVAVGLLLPFSPLAGPFGFVAPPVWFFIALAMIVCFYLVMVYYVKKAFIKKYGYD
jgi:P-type Mg2+ transporter